MNIYQSKIYRKDLSWLHLDDKPRVQVKDYSLTFPFLYPPVEYLLNSHEDHPSQHKNSQAMRWNCASSFEFDRKSVEIETISLEFHKGRKAIVEQTLASRRK